MTNKVETILEDALKQLNVSDLYAKDENNSRVPSVWEIQNSHIRNYLSDLRSEIVSLQSKMEHFEKIEAAAQNVVLSAWTDRFSRLHAHDSVLKLDNILREEA